jgi:adenylate cyclase, class 2
VRIIKEIKAVCLNPEAIEQLLLANGAFLHGIDLQKDTYLKVPKGRLKIREGNVENNLIYYERTEAAGELKESHVNLIAITQENKPIIELLKNALTIKVVVEKKRKIFFIDHIKFHLDEVAQLGHFVEIEAIDNDGTIGVTQLEKDCTYYMQLFGLSLEDIIPQSYSDMLLAAN